MNRIVCFCIFSIIGVLATAQNVPSEINDFIIKKYPSATIAKVKKNGKTFNVKFEANDVKYLSKFKSDFSWIKTEYKTNFANAPTKVANALKKKYSKGKYGQIKVTETEGDTTYSLLVSTPNGSSFDVVLNNKGQFIKNEKIPETAKPVRQSVSDSGGENND